MKKFEEHKTQYGFKQETNNHAEAIIRNDIIVNHTALINDLMHEKGWMEETANLYLDDETLKEQYSVEYAEFLREYLDESETLDEASSTSEACAMDDLRVEYDGTVRDSGQRIIQFSYGGDSIDVSKSDHGGIDLEN